MPIKDGVSVIFSKERLNTYAVFLKAQNFPLDNPKPKDIVEGLWLLLNEWSRRGTTNEVVTVREETQPTNTGPVHPVRPTTEIYSPKAWASLKKNEGTQSNRMKSIAILAEALGEQIPLIESGERSKMRDPEFIDKFGIKLLDQLLTRQADPYKIGRKVVEYMGKPDADGEWYAAKSIVDVVSHIRTWFKINEVPINEELWTMKVDAPKAHREKEKGLLEEEGVKALINRTDDPQLQAVYEVMAITGARISETLSIKPGDISLDKVPGIPILFIRKTKTDAPRYVPLSEECHNLLKKVMGPKPDIEKPIFTMTRRVTYERIMDTLQELGLTKKEQWIRGGGEAWTVTQHNFRQFAEAHMKNSGMDADDAKMLVGRKGKVGSTEEYLGIIQRLAPIWKAKVEPHTHWLGMPVMETPIPKDEATPSPVIQASKPLASLGPRGPIMGPSTGLLGNIWFSRTPNITAPEKVVLPKNRPFIQCPCGNGGKHYIQEGDKCTRLPIDTHPIDDFKATVKDIVDHGVQEIRETIKQVNQPEGIFSKENPLGKCWSCLKYHANPEDINGHGGPCPNKMQDLAFWMGAGGRR